jgi:hypothetical protein
MSVRIEEYVRENGSIPYREWFEDLDSQAAAKVAVAIVRLSLGNTSNVKWFDGIGVGGRHKLVKTEQPAAMAEVRLAAGCSRTGWGQAGVWAFFFARRESRRVLAASSDSRSL